MGTPGDISGAPSLCNSLLSTTLSCERQSLSQRPCISGPPCSAGAAPALTGVWQVPQAGSHGYRGGAGLALKFPFSQAQ